MDLENSESNLNIVDVPDWIQTKQLPNVTLSLTATPARSKIEWYVIRLKNMSDFFCLVLLYGKHTFFIKYPT
jgi:hypothetical protein